MSEVTLKAGGQIHDGWKSVEIRKSMETLAGSFDVSLTEKWPGVDIPRAIRRNQLCLVQIDGLDVIAGHVDRISPSYDKDEHTIQIAGRDAAADLVDCSAVHTPGEWHDQPLPAIAADIAKPFGIQIRMDGDAGARFTKFTIEQGESGFEALDRLCRMRALLASSDGLGIIRIGRAGTDRASVTLERGVNILGAKILVNDTNRFSRYIVKGQRQGNDFLAPDQIAQPSATVEADTMGRYRPLIVLAEDATDGARARDRGKWEANVRSARSWRAQIHVQGWRENGETGSLWRPNVLVRLRDDWIGIDRDLLIVAVTFGKSDDGTTTTLDLMPEKAFDQLLEPEAAEPADGGWL